MRASADDHGLRAFCWSGAPMTPENKRRVLSASQRLVQLAERPMDGRDARTLAGELEAIAKALRDAAGKAEFNATWPDATTKGQGR